MLKYIAIALLLLPLPSPQPRANKGNDNQRANGPELASATPLNSPDIQTKESGTQTPASQPPKANGQADAAKAAQATSDRIASATVVIAVFGILSFFATCGYIVAAFLQWGRAREQAKQAREQVIKMQLTLEAVQNQGKTLRRQAIGTTSQARSTRDMLTETKSLVEQNATMVEHMNREADLMDKSLTIGTRAYVEVHSIETDKEGLVTVRVENIGQIPASNVEVFCTLYGWKDRERYKPTWLRMKYERLSRGNFKIEFPFNLRMSFTESEVDTILNHIAELPVLLEFRISYYDGFEQQVSRSSYNYIGKPRDVWLPVADVKKGEGDEPGQPDNNENRENPR